MDDQHFDPFGVHDTFATDLDVADCGEYVRLIYLVTQICVSPGTDIGDRVVVARIVIPREAFKAIWTRLHRSLDGAFLSPE
jgi:hypothetical protein